MIRKTVLAILEVQTNDVHEYRVTEYTHLSLTGIMMYPKYLYCACIAGADLGGGVQGVRTPPEMKLYLFAFKIFLPHR